MRRSRCLLACLIIATAAAPPALAQWAVIDVSAIGQLVQEVQTLRQQLEIAQMQLQQARQMLQSTEGRRGMEQLLSGTQRNYLPTSWAQLTSASEGAGAYTGLASNVRGAVATNAVLTSAQLATLSSADQKQISAARQAAALRQALAEQALANSSARFAAIQGLIAAIPRATDQKAILELQARIGAELGMLQNEQTKLEVLAQVSQAQESANVQRERELAIAGQGQFSSRFKPAP